MTHEVNGRTLEGTERGFLVNRYDWERDVAEAIDTAEGSRALLTQRAGSVVK